MSLTLTEDEKKLVLAHREKMSLTLTEDEKNIILNMRKNNTLSRKTRPLPQVDGLDNPRFFIERANNRKNHHNRSGDWSWDYRDEPYIREMYAKIGEKAPVSDW